MAEVLDYWPGLRKRPPATFKYPWDQWMDLDENGHGDIWLAELGIDWPANSSGPRFRSILYNRAQRETNARKKNAPLVPKRVRVRSKATGEIRETVRMVPDFRSMSVKVKMVSETQVAFQFYDSDEPPPEPSANKVAIPTRRPPMRQRTAPRSTLRKVKVPA